MRKTHPGDLRLPGRRRRSRSGDERFSRAIASVAPLGHDVPIAVGADRVWPSWAAISTTDSRPSATKSEANEWRRSYGGRIRAPRSRRQAGTIAGASGASRSRARRQ
jgi:hypothetical protein